MTPSSVWWGRKFPRVSNFKSETTSACRWSQIRWFSVLVFLSAGVLVGWCFCMLVLHGSKMCTAQTRTIFCLTSCVWQLLSLSPFTWHCFDLNPFWLDTYFTWHWFYLALLLHGIAFVRRRLYCTLLLRDTAALLGIAVTVSPGFPVDGGPNS